MVLNFVQAFWGFYAISFSMKHFNPIVSLK